MTPEANLQFNLNMDTIARFAGYAPLPKDRFIEEEFETCELCKDGVPEIQIKRNTGICDRCAIGKN